MSSNSTHQSHRKSLLDQIAAITTMQSGTLAEEWRERPDPDAAGTRRIGPYYKHQVWRDGRNISRRVPAAEAAQLREDIDNAKLYEELTGDWLASTSSALSNCVPPRTVLAKVQRVKKTPDRNVCGALRRNRNLYRESQSEPKIARIGRKFRMDRDRFARSPAARRPADHSRTLQRP